MDREYWEKKARELPHFGPVHQEEQPVPEPPKPALEPAPVAPKRDSWQDMGDIGQAILARAIQGQNQTLQPPMAPPAPANVVFLREGQESFRQLQAPVAQPVGVAIKVGPISGVVGREFQYKGVQKFYIAENQNQPIDMSKLDYSRVISLAMVSAPFIGNLLVPESAVIRQQKSGPQLLQD